MYKRQVEVSGQAIFPVIEALPAFLKEKTLEVTKNKVGGLKPEEWYPQQAWLDVLKYIEDEMGAFIMYHIGLAIPERVPLPSGINTLDLMLQMWSQAYQMNHRNSKIEGEYRILEHNKESCMYRIETYTPYPCDMDRGVLTTFVKNFTQWAEIKVDLTKPCKKFGEDTSEFILKYHCLLYTSPSPRDA